MSKLLLWCDTETTGLDPVTDDMLEVAFIVTEDLQIVDEISFVIKKPDIQFLKDKCIPKVYEMHNQNSLWLDLESAKFLMPEVEEKCISFIEKYFDIYVNDSYNAPVLAGSNPIFDKNFLRQNMPTLYELLHYRTFDLNAVYMFMDFKKDNTTPRNHRALSDIYADILAANTMKESVLVTV